MSRAVRVAVPAAEAELAADALWQAGAAAIEERPGLLIAVPAGGGDPAPLVAAVAGRWPAEVVAVDDGAALDAWREHARAVVIGDRLVIRPPWVPAPGGPAGAGAVEVTIDPGRAFGHGAHPTTRLVLDALVHLVGGGERVLDVGCGSGVLAVAALALGADRATGVDTDPAALAATRDNAARNGVGDRLRVADGIARLGDAPGTYDLVVANMLLPDLVAVAPAVAAALAPSGTAVISGLLVDQRDAALAAYRSAGLRATGDRDEHAGDGWLAVTLRAG